jgi:hypothetical protein
MARRVRAAAPLALVVGLAASLPMAACSGYQPMDFPDQRENPTFPGLFTGKDGEWIIYRKEELPDAPDH